jgi:transcriptional regulator with XRE-family HTH domain
LRFTTGYDEKLPAGRSRPTGTSGNILSDPPDAAGKRPNPIDIYVGGRVRMRRKILGLSQERLGSKLGITFQQIQKYEKGTNRIGASRMHAMADALEVPVAYFFPDKSASEGGLQEEGAAFMMEFMSSGEGLELSRAFARIRNTKIRRKVVELVRALADGSEPT